MVYIIHECDYVMVDGNPENAKCRICGKSIMQDVVLPDPKEEKKLSFIKYRSIENAYREKFINQIKEEGLGGGIWIATNKIHGCNFQVCVDSENVKFAKRSTFIGDDENFFGFHTNLVRMKEFLIDRGKRLQNYFGETVNLYFELYGGTYPHPDVRKFNVSAIQGEVFYTPSVDIRLLDIMVDDKFLDFDEMKAIAIQFNLKPVMELFSGSLDAMLSLDPVFDDPTFSEYNLPKIEGNHSEGFVIRPAKEKILKCGDRVMIKHKNPKFAEKSGKKQKVHTPVKLSLAVQEAVDELCACITENRLRNILSHGDTFTNKDFGKLMSMMVGDIIKEEGDCLDYLEKNDRKKVTGILSKEVSNFIRPNFLNIIDGVF